MSNPNKEGRKDSRKAAELGIGQKEGTHNYYYYAQKQMAKKGRGGNQFIHLDAQFNSINSGFLVKFSAQS
jgi:hypothetical protein